MTYGCDPRPTCVACVCCGGGSVASSCGASKRVGDGLIDGCGATCAAIGGNDLCCGVDDLFRNFVFCRCCCCVVSFFRTNAVGFDVATRGDNGIVSCVRLCVRFADCGDDTSPDFCFGGGCDVDVTTRGDNNGGAALIDSRLFVDGAAAGNAAIPDDSAARCACLYLLRARLHCFGWNMQKHAFAEMDISSHC